MNVLAAAIAAALAGGILLGMAQAFCIIMVSVGLLPS